MHELGILMAVTRQVMDFARENGISEVAEIVLEMGEGTGVVPEYLRTVYPAAVRGTMLENAQLVLEIIPGMAMCENCHEIYNVIQSQGACPACGSRAKEILSGQELNIREIHVPG